jgi:hypothetical protein
MVLYRTCPADGVSFDVLRRVRPDLAAALPCAL